MRNAVIFCLLFAVFVFAQYKESVAVLPSVGELDPQRLELLTDKVREIASKNLPQKNFMLLKLDAIIKRIGEEELYRSCKEGVCIGELARKASSDYGARCDIFKIDNSLVLKFELYDVKEEAIVETFTEYKVKDFYAMLDILEARLPDAFKKMVDARNAETAQPKPIAPPAPVMPSTYTVTFSPNGGSGSVSSQSAQAGNSITLPSGSGLFRSGTNYSYTFGGWNTNSFGTGMNYSAGSPYTLTGNVTLYAKWEWNGTPQSSMLAAHSSGGSGATFTDSRDGKTYRKVTIGKQTWMAENLNYDANRSVCYKKKADNCVSTAACITGLRRDKPVLLVGTCRQMQNGRC